MISHEDIWKAIDRFAEAHGYSPSGLARKAGLDPTAFNKSKRHSPKGNPRWPSMESIAKILAATGSTMSEFTALAEGKAAINQNERIKMQDNSDIARQSAKILLDTKSVLFNAREPFTYTSGKKGPVYVDCRRLISFPHERSTLMDFGAEMLRNEAGDDNIDFVAGGETAGIPYAAYISERLKKPMLYVRKKPKGFGRMAQIEGHIPEGDAARVILVEDLQTDGGSKKVFIDALRDAGAIVEHGFVIFHYGIFTKSEENMREMGIKLHALATWWDVLDCAKEEGYFDKETLYEVESFLNDPAAWQSTNN